MSQTAERLESLFDRASKANASPDDLGERGQEVATLVHKDPVGAIAYLHGKVALDPVAIGVRRLVLMHAARAILARSGDV